MQHISERTASAQLTGRASARSPSTVRIARGDVMLRMLPCCNSGVGRRRIRRDVSKVLAGVRARLRLKFMVLAPRCVRKRNKKGCEQGFSWRTGPLKAEIYGSSPPVCPCLSLAPLSPSRDCKARNKPKAGSGSLSFYVRTHHTRSVRHNWRVGEYAPHRLCARRAGMRFSP